MCPVSHSGEDEERYCCRVGAGMSRTPRRHIHSDSTSWLPVWCVPGVSPSAAKCGALLAYGTKMKLCYAAPCATHPTATTQPMTLKLDPRQGLVGSSGPQRLPESETRSYRGWTEALRRDIGN